MGKKQNEYITIPLNHTTGVSITFLTVITNRSNGLRPSRCSGILRSFYSLSSGLNNKIYNTTSSIHDQEKITLEMFSFVWVREVDEKKKYMYCSVKCQKLIRCCHMYSVHIYIHIDE